MKAILRNSIAELRILNYSYAYIGEKLPFRGKIGANTKKTPEKSGAFYVLARLIGGVRARLTASIKNCFP